METSALRKPSALSPVAPEEQDGGSTVNVEIKSVWDPMI
jgi:hypothetical protein